VCNSRGMVRLPVGDLDKVGTAGWVDPVAAPGDDGAHLESGDCAEGVTEAYRSAFGPHEMVTGSCTLIYAHDAAWESSGSQGTAPTLDWIRRSGFGHRLAARRTRTKRAKKGNRPWDCLPLSGFREELRRLRRELELTRQERDFLKKAAAFFAKESR
jgi:hypothetical protein